MQFLPVAKTRTLVAFLFHCLIEAQLGHLAEGCDSLIKCSLPVSAVLTLLWILQNFQVCLRGVTIRIIVVILLVDIALLPTVAGR